MSGGNLLHLIKQISPIDGRLVRSFGVSDGEMTLSRQKKERILLFCSRLFVTLHIVMLKRNVVDIELARGLRKIGFREPVLAYYGVDGKLCHAEGSELALKDHNAPKATPGRGSRCYSAPALWTVQEWLRMKKHMMLLVQYDSFFGGKGSYYCRIVRMKDGLSRDTKPFRTYEQALAEGIRQAVAIIGK